MKLGTQQEILNPTATSLLAAPVVLTAAAQRIGTAVPFNPVFPIAAINISGFLSVTETGGVASRNLNWLIRLLDASLPPTTFRFVSTAHDILVGIGATVIVWVSQRVIVRDAMAAVRDGDGSPGQVQAEVSALMSGVGAGTLSVNAASNFTIEVEHY